MNPKNANYPDHTKAYRLMLKIPSPYSYGHDTLIMCRLPSDEKYLKHQYRDLGFNISEVDGAHSSGYCHLCFLCEDDAKRFCEKYISDYDRASLVTSAGLEDLVRIDQNDDIPCYTQAGDIRDDRVMPLIARRKALPIRASSIDPGNDKLRKRIQKDKESSSAANTFTQVVDKYFKPGYNYHKDLGTFEGPLKDNIFRVPEDMLVFRSNGFFNANGKLSLYTTFRYYLPPIIDYDYMQVRKMFERFNEGTDSGAYAAFGFTVYVPLVDRNRDGVELEEHPVEISATRATVAARTPEKLEKIIDDFGFQVSERLKAIKELGDQLTDTDEL